MTMTVSELKRIIEDLPDDTEVRFAHQPNYPLETHISHEYAVVGCDDEELADLNEELEGLDASDPDDKERYNEVYDKIADLERDGNQSKVLYLAEGSTAGTGYLPSNVCNELGWGR